MADRYTDGPSTPRPIRYNDKLWRDFQRAAARRKLHAADLLRELMIAHLTKPAQEKPGNQHIDESATPLEDVCVEIDLG
jgi:hypothetical protein